MHFLFCISGQLEIAPPTAAQLRYGKTLHAVNLFSSYHAFVCLVVFSPGSFDFCRMRRAARCFSISDSVTVWMINDNQASFALTGKAGVVHGPLTHPP